MSAISALVAMLAAPLLMALGQAVETGVSRTVACVEKATTSQAGKARAPAKKLKQPRASRRYILM